MSSSYSSDRAGFALLTVLWLVTLLASAVAVGLAGSRIGIQVTINRVTLTRARWAAAACVAIAHARWMQQHTSDAVTIDLGRSTFCRWEFVDPTARLNVNVAPPQVLKAFLGDSVAGAVLVRRGRSTLDLRELLEDAGVPDRAVGLLTVDGPGTINANAAPASILSALPGLTLEAVERLLTDRMRHPPGSLDDLLATLSPPARAALIEHYAELTRMLTFRAPQLILSVRGWVGQTPDRLASSVEQLLVPLPDRLAVIRQRVQV